MDCSTLCAVPLRPLLLIALASTACVLPKSVGDDPMDGGGSGTEGAIASSGTTGSIDESTSDVGVTSGMADESTGTTGDALDTGTEGEPLSVCDPQPMEGNALVGFLFDDVNQDWIVDEDCLVTAVDTNEDGHVIGLSCPSLIDPLTIDLTTDLDLVMPVEVDQTVRTRVFEIVTIDTGNQLFISLSEPGGDLLLGYYYDGNGFEDLDDGFYAPLTLQRVDDVCDLEPWEPPPDNGGTFIEEPCSYQIQRAAFDFQLPGGRPQRVLDQGFGTLGAYDLWVLGAVTGYPQGEECTEIQTRESAKLLMVRRLE